jgi:hypothetical protein
MYDTNIQGARIVWACMITLHKHCAKEAFWSCIHNTYYRPLLLYCIALDKWETQPYIIYVNKVTNVKLARKARIKQ